MRWVALSNMHGVTLSLTHAICAESYKYQRSPNPDECKTLLTSRSDLGLWVQTKPRPHFPSFRNLLWTFDEIWSRFSANRRLVEAEGAAAGPLCLLLLTGGRLLWSRKHSHPSHLFTLILKPSPLSQYSPLNSCFSLTQGCLVFFASFLVLMSHSSARSLSLSFQLVSRRLFFQRIPPFLPSKSFLTSSVLRRLFQRQAGREIIIFIA